MRQYKEEIGVNLSFSADTAKVRSQLVELQQQLTNLTSAKTTSTGDKVLQGFSKDLAKASQEAVKLQSILNQSITNNGLLNMTKITQNLKTSGRSVEDFAKSFRTLGPEGEKAFRQITHSVGNAIIPLEKANTVFSKFAEQFKRSASWQISNAVFRNLTTAIGSAYRYAEDLNTSLNNIRIVTGQSTDQMAKFSKEAHSAAKALSTTTTKYTDAALIYYQQGLTGKEVTERTEATIKMANVTKDSAADVSSYMTAIWNNFDKGATSLEHFGDVIANLGANTASSSAEIADGLQKFAAIADTVGLSYDYATTALATVVAQTRQSADSVGTSFKTLFARIQDLELGDTLDDGTTLGKYSEALNKVGINIKTTTGGLKDMDQILDELGAKWSTLSKDTQTALAQNIAGTRQYTQLIALMDNWDEFQKNLKFAQNADGTLQRQQDIYAESWEAASKRVQASFQDLYTKIFDDKAFIGLTNAGADLINIIDKMAESLNGLKGIAPIVFAILNKLWSQDMANAARNVVQSVQMILPGGRQRYVEQQTAVQQQFNEASLSMYDKNSAEYQMADSRIKVQQEYVKLLTQAKELGIELTEVQKEELTTALDNLETVQETYVIKHNQLQETRSQKADTIDDVIAHSYDVNAHFNDTRFTDTIQQAVNKQEALELLKIQSQELQTNITNLFNGPATLEAIQEFKTNVSQLFSDLFMSSSLDDNVKAQLQDLLNNFMNKAIAEKMNPKTDAQGAPRYSTPNNFVNKQFINQEELKIQNEVQEEIENANLKIRELKKLQIKYTQQAEQAEKEVAQAAELVAEEEKKLAELDSQGVDHRTKVYKQQKASVQTAQNNYQNRQQFRDDIVDKRQQVESAINENITEQQYNDVNSLNHQIKQEGIQAAELDTTFIRIQQSQQSIIETAKQMLIIPPDAITRLQSTAGLLSNIGMSLSAITSIGNTIKGVFEGTVTPIQAITNSLIMFPMLLTNSSKVLRDITRLANAYKNAQIASNAIQDEAIAKQILEGVAIDKTVVSEEKQNALKATQLELQEAQNAAAWLNPYILGIGAAVAAIGVITYETYKWYNTDKIAADNAKKHAQETQEAYTQVKTSYDELLSSIENYDNAQQAISELTKDTDEWNKKVQETNANVLELLNSYAGLGKYITNKDGILTISDSGKEYLKTIGNDRTQIAFRENIQAQINKIQMQQKADLVAFARENRWINNGNGYSALSSKDIQNLIDGYRNNPDIFTGNTEALANALGDKWSKEDLSAFSDLGSKIANLSLSVDNNTQELKVYNQQMGDSYLKGQTDYDNSKFKNQIAIKGASSITQEEIDKRIQKFRITTGNQKGVLNEEEVLKQYAALNHMFESELDVTRRALGLGEIKTINGTSLDSVLTQLAQDEIGKGLDASELSKQVESFVQRLGNKASEDLQQAAADFWAEGTVDLASLTKAELQQFADIYQNEDGVSSAVANAEEMWTKATTEAQNTMSTSVKELFASINQSSLDALNSNEYKEVASLMQKAFANQGKEGAAAISEYISQAGKDADKALGLISSISENTNLEEVSKQARESGLSLNGLSDILLALKDISIKSTDAIAKKIAELNKIVNKLQTGDTIEAEDYGKLSDSQKEYFALMIDGTYKLLGSAQQFKDVVQKDNVKLVQDNINKIKLQNSNLNRVQNSDYDFDKLGYTALSTHFTENGLHTYTDFNSQAVKDQLNILRAFGEDETTLAKYTDDLESGFMKPSELQEIAEKVKVLDTSTEGFTATLANNNQEIQKQNLALALSYNNLKDLNEAYKNGDFEGLGNLNAAQNQLNAERLAQGLDADKVNEYKDYIQQQNPSNYSNDTTALEEVEDVMQLDSALSDLSKNYDKVYLPALNKARKAKEDNIALDTESLESMNKYRQAIAKIANVDVSKVSSDINELDQIVDKSILAKAIQGDTDAIAEIRIAINTDALKKDLAENFGEDVDSIVGKDFDALGKTITDFKSIWDDLDIESPIEKGVQALKQMGDQFITNGQLSEEGKNAMISAFQQLAATGKYTADELREIGQAAGYNVEVKEDPETMEYQIPVTTSHHKIINRTPVKDETGKTIGTEYDEVTETSVEYKPVKIQASAPALQVQSPDGTTSGGAISHTGGGAGNLSAATFTSVSAAKAAGAIAIPGTGKMTVDDVSLDNAASMAAPPKTTNKGGGGSKSTPSRTDYDPYHVVNREIKEQEREFADLERAKNAAWGDDFVKAIDAESAAIDREIDLLKKKLEIAKKETELSKKDLVDFATKNKFNVQFDAHGEIANYDEIYTDVAREYNRVIAGLGQDPNNEELKTQKETLSTLKEFMDKYENNLDTQKEMEDKIKEEEERKYQLFLEKFKYEIQLKLNTAEIKRTWIDFQKQMYASTESGITGWLSGARYDLMNLKEQLSDGGAISVLTEAIHSTLDNGELKEADKHDLLKDYMEQMEDALVAIKELEDAIREGYQEAIDDASDTIDKHVQKYQHINKLLEHQKNLVKLIYGEDEFDMLTPYYEKMTESNIGQIQFLKDSIAYWEDFISKLKEGSDEWKSAQEHLASTQEEFNTLIEDSITLIKEQYEQAIKGILKTAREELLKNIGLDTLKLKFDIGSSVNEVILPPVDQLAEAQKLITKINKDIDSQHDNIGAQKKLQELLDTEVELLQNGEEIRQYDVDRANQLYDITLKQIALEDARNAKNNLQLIRDSQGNWVYEYISDLDTVRDAEEELMESEAALFDIDNSALSDYTSDMVRAYEDMFDKIENVTNKYINKEIGEDELNSQLRTITDAYENLFRIYQQGISDSSSNLAASGFGTLGQLLKMDETALASFTDEEQSYIQNVVATTKDFVSFLREFDFNSISDDIGQSLMKQFNALFGLDGEMSISVTNLNEWSDDLIQKLLDAGTLYASNLAAIESASGEDFHDIAGNVNKISTQTQKLIDTNNKVIETIKQNTQAVLDLIKEMEKFVQANKGKLMEAEQAAGSAYEYLTGSSPMIGGIPEPKTNASSLSDWFKKYRKQTLIGGFTDGGIVKAATGTLVGNTGNALLDMIAQSIGEDTMIAVKQGERILSQEQTSAFDNLVYTILPALSDLNGLASTISTAVSTGLGDMLASLNTTTNINTSMLTKPEKTEVATGNVFNINAEFPNATSAQEIEEALLSLGNYASQYVWDNKK